MWRGACRWPSRRPHFDMFSFNIVRRCLVNRLRVHDRATLWCAAASVVVVGAGLVSAPVHTNRAAFRPELRVEVALGSAVTQMSALVNAAVSPPVARSAAAAEAANPTAPGCIPNSLPPSCGWGWERTLTFVLFFYVFLPIQSWVVVPIQTTLDNFRASIQSWIQEVTDSVKAFVATIFPLSASARAVSTPAAARRSSTPGAAAAPTVSIAAARGATEQAAPATVRLPAGSAERNTAQHRRGSVPSAVPRSAATRRVAAAAADRPARAVTRAAARPTAATPRTPN